MARKVTGVNATPDPLGKNERFFVADEIFGMGWQVAMLPPDTME